jgi:hypothetical protein
VAFCDQWNGEDAWVLTEVNRCLLRRPVYFANEASMVSEWTTSGVPSASLVQPSIGTTEIRSSYSSQSSKGPSNSWGDQLDIDVTVDPATIEDFAALQVQACLRD